MNWEDFEGRWGLIGILMNFEVILHLFAQISNSNSRIVTFYPFLTPTSFNSLLPSKLPHQDKRKVFFIPKILHTPHLEQFWKKSSILCSTDFNARQPKWNEKEENPFWWCENCCNLSYFLFPFYWDFLWISEAIFRIKGYWMVTWVLGKRWRDDWDDG